MNICHIFITATQVCRTIKPHFTKPEMHKLMSRFLEYVLIAFSAKGAGYWVISLNFSHDKGISIPVWHFPQTPPSHDTPCHLIFFFSGTTLLSGPEYLSPEKVFFYERECVRPGPLVCQEEVAGKHETGGSHSTGQHSWQPCNENVPFSFIETTVVRRQCTTHDSEFSGHGKVLKPGSLGRDTSSRR